MRVEASKRLMTIGDSSMSNGYAKEKQWKKYIGSLESASKLPETQQELKQDDGEQFERAMKLGMVF